MMSSRDPEFKKLQLDMMTRYPDYVHSGATRSHSSKVPCGKDSTADVEQPFGGPQDETQVPVAASSSQMLVQSPRASRSQHYEVPPGRRPSRLSREDRSDCRARARRYERTTNFDEFAAG
ncbi:uncharacterized protein LOC142575549 [Dermacentor variabilis]|uniref:uncharacterized protein LOC142575549 n=1 Tax=Dermacentor variabilis TaxID=34621 RepID=UPI003F5B6D38